MSEECIICFNTDGIAEHQALQCGHSFHCVCIQQWLEYKDTCPLCRRRHVSANTPACNVRLGRCHGMPVTPELYLADFNWACLSLDHQLEISKPFGVVVRCLTCGDVKSFNYLG